MYPRKRRSRGSNIGSIMRRFYKKSMRPLRRMRGSGWAGYGRSMCGGSRTRFSSDGIFKMSQGIGTGF